MTAEPFVVEVVRSGVVESVHVVDVAVVDAAGALVASAGDPDRPAAFRSSAKPIQARVSLASGWEPADDRALAIACASHNGEPEHVDAVRAILSRAGLDEDALRCPADLPAYPTAIAAVDGPARVTHNCSGKHAGMLAACVAAGWPLETYRDPAHPLQVRVASAMLDALGIVEAQVLVDGCGVPTFVAPLRAFARAFVSIDDGGPEAAAMRAHPSLVGGTGRLDTLLMTAVPQVVSKGGAEGLLCVSTGEAGVALTVRDGASRAAGPVVAAVLAFLGVTDPIPADVAAPPVLGGGEPVGALRARGMLARA